jgi:hypothetical protein
MLNWKICQAAAGATMLLALSAMAQEGPRDLGSPSLVDGPQVPNKADRTALIGGRDFLLPRRDYWLGVLASQPSEEMRQELHLPKDQGLLVEQVQPKSPAEMAGLKEHDVLLKANGKTLGDIHDLMKLIDEVKEGKLTLELLRGGKHETVGATLAKRPADMKPEELGPEAREWFKMFGAAAKDGQPLRFQVFGPGQIVPQGAPGVAATKVEVTMQTKATLSDGSQVEVTRIGDSPAKVIVTHDKERWEAASDDLSKIPEKIRPEVERFAANFRLFAPSAGSGQGNVMYFGGAGSRQGMPGTITVHPNVDERLHEMQKQIDELRAAVQALQGDKSKKQ